MTPILIDDTIPIIQLCRALANEGLVLRHIDGALHIARQMPVVREPVARAVQ